MHLLTKPFLAISLLTFMLDSALPAPIANTEQNAIYALNRLGFGPTRDSLQEVKRKGVEQWIDSQLAIKNPHPLPAIVQAQLDAMPINQTDMEGLFKYTEVPKEFKDNEEYKKAMRAREELLVYETFQRETLRDIYSQDQLLENLTWFWQNHFSVYSQKNAIKIVLADYQEHAIRQHALGKFKDLLRATLEHPAMLMFLDNNENTAPNSFINQNLRPGQTPRGINENYAREVLELHTLGQGNGYTQKDIQELARVLTGFGYRRNTDPIKLRPEFMPYVETHGLFFFDPRRHDFGDKVFMGHVIKGSGYHEIDEVIDILSHNPATARYISTKLAVYFLNDTPSTKIIDKMSQTFLKTDGDIAKTLKVLFHSDEFWVQAKHESKFKLPHQYIYSVLRLSYGDVLITNDKPVLNALYSLGETPYGRQTPDGYALKQKDWASADQMEKRLELIQHLTEKKTRLFSPDEKINDLQKQQNRQSAITDKNEPADNPLNFNQINALLSPVLSEQSLHVIEQGKDDNEKAEFLLSSPEVMNY